MLTNRTPFQDVNDIEVYKNILRGFKNVVIPSIIKSTAKSFVKSLLQDDPYKRLGCLRYGVADIHNHRYLLLIYLIYALLIQKNFLEYLLMYNLNPDD